jgi:hypothetical protein
MVTDLAPFAGTVLVPISVSALVAVAGSTETMDNLSLYVFHKDD